VNFLRDQPGRVSHHLRAGWSSPWVAGWNNLQAMLVGAADFFLIKPGIVLLLAGLALMLSLVRGPLLLGRVTLSLNTMMMALTMSVVGLEASLLGGVARALYDLIGRDRKRLLRMFSYTRTSVSSLLVILTGFWLTSNFVARWVHAGYTMIPRETAANHTAVLGLFMIIAALHIFMAMLLMHGVVGFAPLSDQHSEPGNVRNRIFRHPDIHSVRSPSSSTAGDSVTSIL